MSHAFHPTMQFYEDPTKEIDCYHSSSSLSDTTRASAVRRYRNESDNDSEIEGDNNNENDI